MSLDDTIKMGAGPGAEWRARKQSNAKFTAMIVASVVVHVGGFAFLGVWAKKQPHPIDLQNAMPVELVRLGKERDPALLPRLVATPPPASDDGVALEKDKPTETEKVEKIEKPKEKVPELSEKAKKMLEGARLDNALNKLKPEEAEGSAHGSRYGTTTSGPVVAGYHADVIGKLQASYTVPSVIPESQRRFLKASVILYIAPNGRIIKHEFVEKHPNQTFMNALETMLGSIMLPPPPKSLAESLSRDGVVIMFQP